jgi:gluconolactonase
MLNLSFTPPIVIEASVLTRIPDRFRRPGKTSWSEANKPGQVLDSFLEGPVFDRAGNLYVTDLPFGRIFRIGIDLEWEVTASYDGWPNGMTMHADGSLWIADYRHGILRCDPTAKRVDPVLARRNSESFKGTSDLVFDANGRLYFTDQGQTGLHDPTGRVYRLGTDGRLDLLLSNAPSPNGIVLSGDGGVLYVAMTRGNQVWRAPLLADGSISKMGAFQTFFGASGPDGMAATTDGGIVMAHASLGGAFVINARGEITHHVRTPIGQTVTNVAFRPGTSELVMTEAQTGTVLTARLPVAGVLPFSHSSLNPP